jgi:hypothetical protein
MTANWQTGISRCLLTTMEVFRFPSSPVQLKMKRLTECVGCYSVLLEERPSLTFLNHLFKTSSNELCTWLCIKTARLSATAFRKSATRLWGLGSRFQVSATRFCRSTKESGTRSRKTGPFWESQRLSSRSTWGQLMATAIKILQAC